MLFVMDVTVSSVCQNAAFVIANSYDT
jgi:hypothetical protein